MSNLKFNLPLNNEQELTALLTSTLLDQFKLNEFRDGQLAALHKLLKVKSLLCIQPTGHGKSLLYQLPTVLLPGITIVISPLLALMRDQINQLQLRFNINSASINSDQTLEENQQAQMYATAGRLQILFISPEKLDNLDYLEFLYSLPISLVVIDEAHCISTWGHDFRPSYRQIIHFINNLKATNLELHLLALTATANERTEADIIKQLSSQENNISIVRQSMNRDNLKLHVISSKSTTEKLYHLQNIINQLQGCGLIYCATRDNTELVNTFLNMHGVNSAAYHAGINTDEKRQLQNDFINNKYQVISATNALGMGIDKSDLRYIIHFDIPGSITAYYQEIGRAGRDGKPAYGILLFNEKDKKIQNHFIRSAQPSSEDFKNVLDVVKTSENTLGLIDIKRLTGLHPTKVNVVISELVEQQFIEKQKVASKQVYIALANLQNINISRYENQFNARQNELAAMLNFAANNQSQCLMATLRLALGDQSASPCNHCSHCTDNIFDSMPSSKQLLNIENYLDNQTVPISLGKQQNCLNGIAILNSKLRQPLFIEFMWQRQVQNIKLNDQLLKLLSSHLEEIKQLKPSAIIVIPSQTWDQRQSTAEFLARLFDIPVYLDCLKWKNIPEHRQGELLNNDQRRFNVKQNMTATFEQIKPTGNIILFDDYIGSNATMKEAARALIKDAGFSGKIIPLTIAAITWRLGQRGMI